MKIFILPRRSRIPVAIVLLSVLAGVCLPISSWRGMIGSEQVHAQPAEGERDSEPAQFKGSQKCFDCHQNGPSEKRRADFCFLTEAQYFRLEENVRNEDRKRFEPLATVSELDLLDKHVKAYKVLESTVLGKQMKEKLGIPDYENEEHPNYDKAKQCLSCHSNWRQDKQEDGDFHNRPKNYSEGVSCEACHGPSSKWEDPHAEASFRKMSPQKKQTNFELVDVRNPIHRAEQCFSCHIGNVEQGKVVTHEMYAAGHPPLPGIELETFANAMPPHWRNIREKGHFEFRKEFIEANYGPGWDDSKISQEMPRTKSVLIGAVIAQREAVQLLSQLARKKGPAHLNYEWPDLTAFDCAACHHDLRTDSWRQKKKVETYALGRPALKAWPDALITAVLQHVADDNEEIRDRFRKFQELRGNLNEATTSQPFGDAELIPKRADILVAWLDKLATDLVAKPCTEADAISILKELTHERHENYTDFDSARQLAWAIQVVYAEWKAGYPEFKARRLPPAEKDAADIKDFQEWRDGKRKNAMNHAAKLLGLEKPDGLVPALALELRTGQQYRIEKELPRTLSAASNYVPEKFAEQLRRIRAELDRLEP